MKKKHYSARSSWTKQQHFNMKWHINLFLNPSNSLASTFDSLTWPPPPLLPVSPLAAPANTLVIRALYAPAMSTDMMNS